MNTRFGLTVPRRVSTCCRFVCLPFLTLTLLQAAPAWKSELTSSAPGPFPNLAPTSLKPQFFQASETDDKEKIDTTVRYFPTRVESREVSKLLKTGKTTQSDRAFQFAPVFDIFSAMLHIHHP